jgi:hypothetical protein
VTKRIPDVYEHSSNNRYRYTLGYSGSNRLIVLGVNPSTACPEKLDGTVKNVETFTQILGFDSYLMCNLYPQRSTDPKGIHKRCNKAEHFENLKIFEKHLIKDCTIWAAWGVIIEDRAFLFECLKDLYQVSLEYDCHWIKYGELTKAGHPVHPLYKKHVDRFSPFDVETYLSKKIVIKK